MWATSLGGAFPVQMRLQMHHSCSAKKQSGKTARVLPVDGWWVLEHLEPLQNVQFGLLTLLKLLRECIWHMWADTWSSQIRNEWSRYFISLWSFVEHNNQNKQHKQNKQTIQTHIRTIKHYNANTITEHTNKQFQHFWKSQPQLVYQALLWFVCIILHYIII